MRIREKFFVKREMPAKIIKKLYTCKVTENDLNKSLLLMTDI